MKYVQMQNSRLILMNEQQKTGRTLFAHSGRCNYFTAQTLIPAGHIQSPAVLKIHTELLPLFFREPLAFKLHLD